jgi:[ribosomal protein S5]-alanine N-acetyltransferase
VSPPLSTADFRAYVNRNGREDFRGFLICRNDTRAIAGVVNISQIFRGAFQCAYLGFYAMEGHQAQGLMREGLAMTLGVAFRELKLHRLEANIQPSNVRSADLVKSLGFRLEGFSPRYLKIAGRWRDHDRWAILREQFPNEALGIRGRGH